MSSTLFKEGVPNQIRNMGNDQFQMSVSIPTDSDGRLDRACANDSCSPGYFKITPGTGITGGQESAYCPYCRHDGDHSDFTTEEQIRYAKDTVFKEAESQGQGVSRPLTNLPAYASLGGTGEWGG